MPIETTPEAEQRIVDEADIEAAPPDRLPVFQTVLAGYRIVAENLISFVAIAISLAAVHFSLMQASPLFVGVSKASVRDVLLHFALALTSIVCASVVLAIVCIRWYRRLLLDERRHRSAWFGPRENQFAVYLFLFYLVLAVPGAISQSAWGEIGTLLAYRLEQGIGYPVALFWPTVIVLWNVLAVTWLFFTFPGIALEIRGPLEHGMRVARRAFPSLFLVYLIGLIPWLALEKLGIPALIFHVDAERLMFAATILNLWTMICSIALAGAAYREITKRELLDRLSIDFE